MAAGGDRDPRLAELEQMGLARSWLRVAEAIGVDNFHQVWKILDAEFPEEVAGKGLTIWMRSYRSYLRYQRNRFIESLFAEGKSVAEIRALLREVLGENVSPRHISRKRPKQVA